MKTITQNYKEAIKEFGKQLDSKITYELDGETVELGAEELNSITPTFQGGILKSVMRELDIDSNEDIPLNTVLTYQFGVKVGNSYEYINYGNFIVYKSEKQEDTRSYKLTCYDKMLYAMKDYEEVVGTYPMTVRDYITELCDTIGLTFKNASGTFANYDKLIPSDLYKGIGYTYRDVLDELAQVTASTICINEQDDELEIRYVNEGNVYSEVTGSSLSLDPSYKGDLGITPSGISSQESTTGKQLLNLQDVSKTVDGVSATVSKGHVTLKGTNTNTSPHAIINQNTNLPTFEAGETYTLSKYKTTGGIYSQFVYSNGTTYKALGYLGVSERVTFTVPSDFVSLIAFQIYIGSTTTNVDLDFDIMLAKGSYTTSTMPEFEIFSGGQPAPNPEYPYSIKDVTGDNEIEIVNKNLFRINNYSKVGWNVFIENPIKISGTYTVSCVNKYVTANKGFAISFATAPNNQSIISGKFADYAFGNTLMQSTGNVTEEQANAQFMVFQVQDGNCNQQVLENMQIMIEKGSTATDYVEHKSQSYLLSLGVDNKFNILDSSVLYANVTTENNIDFTYIPTSTSNSDYPVSCKENTAYTFSTKISTNVGADFYIYFVYTDNTDENVGVLSGTGTQSKTITNTSNASKTLSKISFRHYGIGTYNNYLISKPQLEEGTHASSYSPYGQEPIHLRGIGDYKDSIRRSTGKNLIGYNNSLPYTVKGVMFTRIGENYVLSGTATGYPYKSIYTIPSGTLNGDYLLKKIKVSGTSNAPIRIMDRTTTPNVLIASTENMESDEKTFNISDNHNNLDVEIVCANGVTYNETFEVLLQLSSITDKSPEPYGEGLWYVHKEIGDVVLDGSETWYRWTTNTFYITKLTEIRSALSNYYTYNSTATGGGQLSNGEFFIHDSLNNNVVIFKNTGVSDTIEDFKTWLSTHNTEVQYPLANSTYETIESETLINQLNELEYAYSYNGQTNVFTNGDLQMPLNVKYISSKNIDTIDEESLKDVNVEFGEKYGPVNSIVLSRSAESDNVYLQDEESIEENGLCEIKIKDNQIMNFNDRSDYLPDILRKLNGLEYYINDFTSTGVTYLELCDRYNVEVFGNTYSCILFNDETKVTQGLEEVIYTDMPEGTVTDYSKADKTDRRINQVYIIADKQAGQIQSLVTQNIENENQIRELQTQMTQTSESLQVSVSELTEQLNQTSQDLSESIDNINSTLNDGVESLKNTLVTIDINGISVSTNTSAISTLMTNDKFAIQTSSGQTLAYFGYDYDLGKTVSRMDNLEITTYLTAGYHRQEKMDNGRTGWFYNGGA